MKVLYYDCFSGISGDMNLGALLDIGVNESYLRDELRKLNVAGYELHVKREKKMGIEGTMVTVKLTHQHSHGDHHHHHHEPHRNLKDIYKIIDDSALNDSVKESAKKMFLLIGEAEAKIHGKSIDEIHFHEVGAIDSIVDIVGAAICLEKLNVDYIMSSSIELGGGFVKCAHGTFPVPAPATAEILSQIPVKKGAVNQETTTPTGAAILAANVNQFSDIASLTIQKTGYGIGQKDMEIPNVLRVHLAETGEKQSVHQSYITECNIDDMNPELYEHIMDALFNAGASDVYFVPIQMKKNRPSVKVSVLHRTDITKEIEKILLHETSTFGLRRYTVEKIELERDVADIDYKESKIRIKLGYINGKMVKAKPEYQDCKIASDKYSLPIQQIYREINDLINQKFFKL